MASPGLVSVQRLSDTTPPQQKPSSLNFKPLMNELAEMFPKLGQNYQEQARQAQSHVQFLMREGHNDQAMSLMNHMRDVMRALTEGAAEPVKAGAQVEPAAPPPLPFSDETAPSIPPLPPSSSLEMRALQRSVEDMQMKMKENSAINLIAKRVRDMDMEQKYFQLEERLRALRDSVGSRLESINALTHSATVLAKRELRKRTVSKNPFCDHEASGFCEFCVGRDMEDTPAFIKSQQQRAPITASPVPQAGLVKEEQITKEMVIHMQQSLKEYQRTMKDLLEQRKSELAALKGKDN
jgi:hypothetical protein